MKPSLSSDMAYISIIAQKPNAISYGFTLCIAVIFYFLMPIATAHCTTVITIRTPNEVIIGADSFLGDKDKNVTGSICKIRQAGDVFMAFAGVPVVQGEGFDFNIFEIAGEVFSRKAPIEERIETFDSIVKFNIKKIVNHIKDNKKLFETVYKYGDGVAASITIAINTKDYPVIYHIEYTVTSSAHEPAKIKSVIEKHIEKLVSEIDLIWSRDDADICRGVMSKANIADLVTPINDCIKLIAKSKTTVRLPVDILRITSNGAEWVQHKPECTDIRTSTSH